MNNIESNFKENENKMRIGTCIQLESYLDFIILAVDKFGELINDNSCLFPKFSFSDHLSCLDNIKGILFHLHDVTTNDLLGLDLEYTDYLKKYNT